MDGGIEGSARGTGCAAGEGEVEELGTGDAAVGSGVGDDLGAESGSAVGDELVHILVVDLGIYLSVNPVLYWVVQIAEVNCWLGICSIRCSWVVGGLIGSRSVWLGTSVR